MIAVCATNGIEQGETVHRPHAGRWFDGAVLPPSGWRVRGTQRTARQGREHELASSYPHPSELAFSSLDQGPGA